MSFALKPSEGMGVAESSYECQFCTYQKVGLSIGFKNPIKEDSYLKSATPNVVGAIVTF